MMSYLRRLTLLVLVLATVFVVPGIGNALPEQLDRIAVVASSSQTELDLTPRQRQMIQAINRGLNREVSKILNESQQKSLVKLIHTGDTLNQALDKLQLSSEKREIIKAVSQVYDLKMKSLISGF
ncbi:MAG: hypothetical protein IGS39_06095 [Calothrix sp. C42_A2020_038]|nr:hypothetical protein [Calothrix sp. C42_A2020_038]